MITRHWDRRRAVCLIACAVGAVGMLAQPGARSATSGPAEPGTRGGQLVIAQRAEPKTFNPVMAMDAPAREVLRRLTADLIHINRQTLGTEPSLARTWSVSPDGRRYTIALRPGLRFSDGHACDADDVVFSFSVYLDEAVHSPQRDVLMVGGRPIVVRKVDSLTVTFDVPQPYAAAERLFDSVAILPRHLLEKAYRDGTIAQAWGLSTDPHAIAGLGPFRLARYVPGERIVLERNPYYWKTDARGQQLPYLDQLTFIQVPDENAQALRFDAAETDVITRLTADDFDLLSASQRARGYRLYDLGPGLEYNFLFFNLADLRARNLPNVERKQGWFRNLAFRQAVSAAVDRDAIVRIVYRGRGTPLWAPVTPGNRLWINASLPHPARSVEQARQTLRAARFSWDAEGRLRDPSGAPVQFSILVAAGNQPRMQMATIIQDDLKQLGLPVTIAALEFRALLDRVLDTRDYEACLLGLSSGDADPSADMSVWLSSGPTHLWNPGQAQPATAWEAEIDDLMRKQFVALDRRVRKTLFDRVQAILAEQLPIICLASPNILVGARAGLANFRPAILDHYVLSNADELFWRAREPGGTR